MGERVLPRAAAAALLVASMPLFAACAAKDRDPDVIAGKRLFVERCGSCHVLNRAATKGTSGPNLDAAFQRALQDGFGETAVRGVVLRQIQEPNRMGTNGVKMPADLVTGDEAHDVAAYVSQAAAKPGKDTGLLASAVKAAGTGKPAVAKDGVLEIDADPNGQLAYVTKVAEAPAGPLKVQSKNDSAVEHDIAIDGLGKGQTVKDGGVSSFDATVDAGQKYTYYCTLPGHRQAGMEGTLTVK